MALTAVTFLEPKRCYGNAKTIKTINKKNITRYFCRFLMFCSSTYWNYYYLCGVIVEFVTNILQARPIKSDVIS